MSGPSAGKKELPSIPGKVRAGTGSRIHLGTAGAGLKTRSQHGYDAHPRHRTPGRTTTKYYNNTAQEKCPELN